ncbi:protein ALP1-like [Dendronephthya gigantea]|uniref:protein ALP1-like n=1 Tax=Dendronephthya gigantea TaxID=151771 RepID=UPI00106D30D9|nr:protein ALP1-like [Dendronephthya gigantea]
MELAFLEYQFDLIALTIRHIENNRRKRRKRKRREVWMRSWMGRRRQFGIYDQLLVELRSEDTRYFKNFMRMVPEMFDELLARVSPRITKKHTWYRRPLEPGLKLSLTLRHLASGSTYSAMKYGWRVPHNTQSLIVREVCQAIIDEYMSEVMTCPTTPEGWRAISDKFLKRWNFPHTCGAIDGKHIACKCPPKNADYKFIWADLGGKGSSSDAQIYNNSEIKELTEDGTIGFPAPDALPNDYQSVPYFFVGDDAFALRETMMKPYSRRGLHHEERIFNYRISRARRVVENAFGILTNRFQVLLTTMQHHTATVKLIVKACIVLHNLMRIRYPELQNQHLDHAENMNNNFIPGSWRQDRMI